MKITFWGAIQGVTGSMTFVHMPEGIVLIDCGLVQGTPEVELQNEVPLPLPPSEIKAVVLTHAHLDHSGYLPRLVKKGFRGPIYCTKPTSLLTRIILEDSASLDKMELYEEKDVIQTLHLIRVVDWNHSTELLGGKFSLFSAGHILGASSVKMTTQNKSVVFSGDLGRINDPLIEGPKTCPPVDLVVMESTYGGKIRQGNLEKELFSFLVKISREKRVGIIASFAVARGQMLITLINDFFSRHPEEKINVVIDSPMMCEANRVYRQFSFLTKIPDVVKHSLEKIESIDHERQWESLAKKSGPLLIISSSGMLTGGRIARHLQNWQDDEKAILFLPGFQAEATPGRAFSEGHRSMLGPDNEMIHWKGEVMTSDAFSSHADQTELLEWVSELSKDTNIFLVHGETSSKQVLKERLQQNGFSRVNVPERSESIIL